MMFEDKNNPIHNAKLDGPVILDPLTKTSVNGELGRALDQLGFLRTLVMSDKLSRSDVKTHLQLLRYTYENLSKNLDNGETVSAELENATAMLRAANKKIRDLESQLGAGLTGDALSAGMKHYEDLFRAWYERAGFHYASVTFTPWCLQADFGDELVKPGQPEAHCAPHALFDLMCVEYSINALEKHEDTFKDILLATDYNREELTKIFKSNFPGSRISKFEYHKDRELWTMRFVALVPFQDIYAMAEKCLEKEKTT